MVGFLPDNTQASSSAFILDTLSISSGIITPPKGSGALWVYSKHYVNITSLDGSTGASNVGVCVLSSQLHDQVHIAAALTHEEGISGAYHYGFDQSNLPWTNGALPLFAKAQGWPNKILLTNGSGEPGSVVVGVDSSTGNSLGFWVARKFTENYEFAGAAGNNYIRLGFSAKPE